MIQIKNRWNGEVIKEIDAENLRGSDLSGSNLSDCNLSDCNLRGSNLSDCDLSGSDLSGSNLSDCDLSDCDLSGSDLRDCDLSGSDLSGADLCGAINAPLIITGLRWVIQISGTGLMQIGCQKHSCAEWAAFDDERIASMEDGATEFWSSNKQMLMALCDQWKHPE